MLTGLNNYTRNISVLLTVLSMINRLNISTHCAYWVILQVIPCIRGFHVSQNFGKLGKCVTFFFICVSQAGCHRTKYNYSFLGWILLDSFLHFIHYDSFHEWERMAGVWHPLNKLCNSLTCLYVTYFKLVWHSFCI